jgi:hypothetical protein
VVIDGKLYLIFKNFNILLMFLVYCSSSKSTERKFLIKSLRFWPDCVPGIIKSTIQNEHFKQSSILCTLKAERTKNITFKSTIYLLYSYHSLLSRIQSNFRPIIFASTYLNFGLPLCMLELRTSTGVIPCQTSKNKSKISPWVENFKIDIFRGFYIQF